MRVESVGFRSTAVYYLLLYCAEGASRRKADLVREGSLRSPQRKAEGVVGESCRTYHGNEKRPPPGAFFISENRGKQAELFFGRLALASFPVGH
jgi:hypothetical protein